MHDCLLPVAPESVAVARQLVGSWLQECGCASGVVSDARLAVSEAVSNVVLHSYLGRVAADLELRTEHADGSVVVVVRDHGRGLVARDDSPGLGLGLGIIEKVTRALSVRQPSGGGVELRMTFTAAG